MFKIGDVVEFAGLDTDTDTGTVTQVFPYVKVRWNSDGVINTPALEDIRLLEIDGAGTKETKEDYYLCLTKEEVEIFMNSLSTYKNEYYCSEYESTQSVIANLIAFRNKAKEAKEKEEQIQKALDLLSNSGYTCTKN